MIRLRVDGGPVRWWSRYRRGLLLSWRPVIGNKPPVERIYRDKRTGKWRVYSRRNLHEATLCINNVEVFFLKAGRFRRRLYVEP